MRNIRTRKGFTLVEILTVVALIAILFVIFVPRIDFATTKTREVGVETDFREFDLAFESVAKLNAGFMTVDPNGNTYVADTYADAGTAFAGASTVVGNTSTGDDTSVTNAIKAVKDNAANLNKKALAANTARLSDTFNSYLDGAMKIVITNIDASNNVVGWAISKVDPWNINYKIYGHLTADGAESWMQAVCFGPDKIEASATGAASARESVASGSIGYSATAANCVQISKASDGNASDNYSMTVFYGPTGVTMRSDGFDSNVKAG